MTKQERAHLLSVSNPYNGGRNKATSGYVTFFFRDETGHKRRHPEHTLVMEHKIGRKLFDFEVAHHINRNPSDNREENLLLMTKRAHLHLHAKTHPWKRGVYPLTRW